MPGGGFTFSIYPCARGKLAKSKKKKKRRSESGKKIKRQIYLRNMKIYRINQYDDNHLYINSLHTSQTLVGPNVDTVHCTVLSQSSNTNLTFCKFSFQQTLLKKKLKISPRLPVVSPPSLFPSSWFLVAP